MSYSNSYIQQYKSCPLSCFYKYEAKLKKIDDEASEHHLVYGRAMHAALRLIYLGDSVQSAKTAFLEQYVKQLDTLDNAKTRENGVIVLDAYMNTYIDDMGKWKVVSCEEKEHFEYGGEDSFTVILDLVMENRAYGGIYGFDHKIVGGKKANLSEDFWYQFEPNSQVNKYCSFIKSKYGDCSGFYINAIGMGYRSRMYKGEPAGFHFRFRRNMFNPTVEQLERENSDTKYWIERIEHSKATSCFGMNTEACRWCEYRTICKSGWKWPEDKELIEITYSTVSTVAPSERKKENNDVKRSGISSE